MTTDTTIQELDQRTNDGIAVALLWDRAERRVFVTVDDARTGDSFVLEVAAGESPLDVFRHPYAYAALQRVDTRAAAQLAA
jgi:hypothetical protein